MSGRSIGLIDLIILPNLVVTNPEVVENLLYVGGDDGGEEEEGAHLHHEQEAGGHYDDERWAGCKPRFKGEAPSNKDNVLKY